MRTYDHHLWPDGCAVKGRHNLPNPLQPVRVCVWEIVRGLHFFSSFSKVQGSKSGNLPEAMQLGIGWRQVQYMPEVHNRCRMVLRIPTMRRNPGRKMLKLGSPHMATKTRHMRMDSTHFHCRVQEMVCSSPGSGERSYVILVSNQS
jgi:hypothetical protein